MQDLSPTNINDSSDQILTRNEEQMELEIKMRQKKIFEKHQSREEIEIKSKKPVEMTYEQFIKKKEEQEIIDQQIEEQAQVEQEKEEKKDQQQVRRVIEWTSQQKRRESPRRSSVNSDSRAPDATKSVIQQYTDVEVKTKSKQIKSRSIGRKMVLSTDSVKQGQLELKKLKQIKAQYSVPDLQKQFSVPDLQKNVNTMQIQSQMKSRRSTVGVNLNTAESHEHNFGLLDASIEPDDDSDEYSESVSPNVQYKSRADKVYIDEESQDDSVATKYSYVSKVNQRAEDYKLQQEIEKERVEAEEEELKRAIGAGGDTDVKPNQRFKNFKDLFGGLTKSKNVITMYNIISCMITYNSKSVVTVTKASDREYYVKQYSLESYALTFEEKIGGSDISYIKAKDVEQNSNGTKFMIVYYDDGLFKFRNFGVTTRTQKEIEENELNINEELNFNNHTMPIDNFPEPYVSCCFTNDDIAFISLFLNQVGTHYHFFFNMKTREMSGLQQLQIDSNDKNFPWRSFYNSDENEIYTFYRQGQSYRIPVHAIESPKNKNKVLPFIYEKIIDKVLGQMYLINNKALIARCSCQVLFFKLQIDLFTKEEKWTCYHVLDHRGMVYFIKGNKRIQVTTDEQIYFYLIDPVTFVPTLENVMYNYMNCSQMMFGSKVRYCVTFKANQKSFDIHRRKYVHDFRQTVVKMNLDGSRGLPIESMNAFLVSKVDVIHFYDVDTFRELKGCLIQIPLFKSETREKNEIISMQLSNDENYIAVISGKNLVMDEQKANQLFIFKRTKNKNKNEDDVFILLKRVVIKDNPQLNKISMQFHFKKVKGGKEQHQIIFAQAERIIEFDYMTESLTILNAFAIPLAKQPEFFSMNNDQSCLVIASQDDGIYYNFKTRKFIDLDEKYDISNIKEIIYDHEEKVFYILCNKYAGKLGVFLLKFSQESPSEFKFVLKWKNKLDIADADVNITRNHKKKFKELVISFKTIYMNTFNVQVIDISTDVEKMMFRHESFQLWESQITGFYITSKKEFITINNEGINVLSLDSGDKRQIAGDDDQEKMIHCLESTNYLKIDPSNFIYFEFASEPKIITVMQQFTKQNSKSGEETDYETIQRVRICDITLRELLLFQSLYVCKTQSDILKLVNDQPHPDVFYKSFLELDGSNMVSILSFDSRSMKQLLSKKHEKFFQAEYPIFYKNKIQKSNNNKKFFYRSAIDSALKNNQIRAVGYIVEYIVKYQNTYVSSFLFLKNINVLIDKGVLVSSLFNSQIFQFQFDYDEWPSSHTDSVEYIRPFNASIFDLRTSYDKIFHEARFNVNLEEEGDLNSSMLFKVSYSLNMLPVIGEYCCINSDGTRRRENEGLNLLEIFNEATELDIFECKSVQNLIEFKWNNFAYRIHFVGCIAHFSYVFMMGVYINEIYIHNRQDLKRGYSTALMVAIIYPTIYEIVQQYKIGFRKYFSDPFNYSDILYTWGGIANIIVQNMILDSQDIWCKILMCILLIQQILKTFFFLRIFETLSYIVTMLNQVLYDLRVFLLFYFILLTIFSFIFAVLGVGNKEFGLYKEYYGENNDNGIVTLEDSIYSEVQPLLEYHHVGLLFGYLFTTLRMSLSDFEFAGSIYMTEEENLIYWLMWFLVVMTTCIIFLNFIIAEASESYGKVMARLEAMVQKEKSGLISEAEDIMFDRYKDEARLPKYMIIRSIET